MRITWSTSGEEYHHRGARSKGCALHEFKCCGRHKARRSLVLFLLIVCAGCGNPQPRLVLYCAQDQEFAEKVLDDFTKRTGLAVAPKYDTEANKSVSLYMELMREKSRPRCDVHWNNEILSTIR